MLVHVYLIWLPNAIILVFHLAPTGAPRDVTPSMTSRSIMLAWDTIECIEQNGRITGYTVVFQEQGGANVPGSVNTVDRTFFARGLTPGRSYTFQVAGVNDVGTGPFTEITITTDEEGFDTIQGGGFWTFKKPNKGEAFCLMMPLGSISLQFLVLCLTSLPCPSSHL